MWHLARRTLFTRFTLTAFVTLALISLAPTTVAATPALASAATADAPAPAAPAPAAETSAQSAVTDPAAQAEAPPAPKPIVQTLAIAVDLTAQRLTVTAHGKQIHAWPISSGTREFPTPTGTFRPAWMAKMWFSRKYDDAPMPHAVFFKDGAAIHGTTSVRSLGRAASHGCVRLAPSNAATLYGLVTKHGMAATRISVFGTPKWREDVVASRSERAAPAYPSMRRYAYAPIYAGSPYAPAFAPAPSSGYDYPGDAPRAPVVMRSYAMPYGYAPPRRVIYSNYGRYIPPGYARY